MKPFSNVIYRFITVSIAIFACTSCAPMSGPEECLNSSQNTLVLSDRGYSCQRASNQCDDNFRQAVDGAEVCTAKAGCEFLTGFCYCPPNVQCVCGGGPPSQCAQVDDQSDHLQRHRNMMQPVEAKPESKPEA